tara:strand:+ start:3625 stop:3771 length:147 start_codon:yes stop_codon:yes gene_type:complete
VPNLFFNFFFKELKKSELTLVLTNLTFEDFEVPDNTSLTILSFLIVYF